MTASGVRRSHGAICSKAQRRSSARDCGAAVFERCLPRRFNIGACDWSIGMRGKTGAMALARQLGLDGAQISMGSVESDLHLRQPDVQRSYRDAAEAAGVRLGGIALDVLNQVPYKSDPRTEQWVSDSIDVARALNARVVLLAFFDRGDLRDDADGQAEVIRRLKRVARKAEERGVILGIESWLSARDHLRIIDAVGSSQRAGLLRRGELDAEGLRHQRRDPRWAASESASFTPRRTASCSGRARSISPASARRWTTSATGVDPDRRRSPEGPADARELCASTRGSCGRSSCYFWLQLRTRAV